MFYIRADANPNIGTGHIMRCLSIAKEISKLGEEVIFINADLQSEHFIIKHGYSVLCLNSEWDNLESELDQMIKLIQKNKIDKVLIDSYYVTRYYLTELGKYTKTIYLDDLATFLYPVDMLVNYNIYADNMNYKNCYDGKRTHLVLGCTYAPLREEFRNTSTVYSKQVKKILLSTGGADQFHVAFEFLNYMVEVCFLDTSVLEFHVVAGKFNADREQIQKLSEKYSNIKVYFDNSNMAELMCQCDLAITAGGFIMYELCACGVPMITYTFADNQLLGVLEFECMGIARYSGDIRSQKDDVFKKILETIKEYCSDSGYRKELIARMKFIVDGYGAQRLAREMIEL